MIDAIELPLKKVGDAESVLSILSQLDASKLPWEERVGLGVCQAKAMQQGIEGARAAWALLRYERLFSHERAGGESLFPQPAMAKLHAPREEHGAITPLSSFLVDRAHPDRQ